MLVLDLNRTKGEKNVRIKRKDFHTVMNYSKYLDYYLYIISNKSYERNISQVHNPV